MGKAFKPYQILNSQLERLPISEGQFIVTTDDNKIYVDVSNTERHEIASSGAAESPLKGKKITVCGDSISAGYLANTNWPTIVGQKTGAIVTNLAVTGASLGYKQGLACIAQQVQSIVEAPDYVVIMGGCNDFMANIPVGTKTDADYSTTRGSLTLMLGHLQKNFPTTKILVATDMPFSGGIPTEDSWFELRQFLAGIAETCDIYHIPFLNLMSNFGLNPQIQEIKDLYYANDLIHLTDLGQNYLAEKMQKFLENENIANESVAIYNATKDKVASEDVDKIAILESAPETEDPNTLYLIEDQTEDLDLVTNLYYQDVQKVHDSDTYTSTWNTDRTMSFVTKNVVLEEHKSKTSGDFTLNLIAGHVYAFKTTPVNISKMPSEGFDLSIVIDGDSETICKNYIKDDSIYESTFSVSKSVSTEGARLRYNAFEGNEYDVTFKIEIYDTNEYEVNVDVPEQVSELKNDSWYVGSPMVVSIMFVDAIPAEEEPGVLYLIKEEIANSVPVNLLPVFSDYSMTSSDEGYTIATKGRAFIIDGYATGSSFDGYSKRFFANLEAGKTYSIQFAYARGTIDDTDRVANSDGMVLGFHFDGFRADGTSLKLHPNTERSVSQIYDKYTFTMPTNDSFYNYAIFLEAKRYTRFDNFVLTVTLVEESV